MNGLVSLWQHVASTQPAPPRWVVAASAVTALLLVAARRPWRVARVVVTLVHEGGHAVASLATGRRLEGIRLHADTSGTTSSRGRSRGAGAVVTAAAGYPSPSVAGVVAARVLAAGHPAALLTATVFLLAAVFTVIRNLFGFLAVLATAGVVVAVDGFGSATAQDWFAYLFAWFLLLGGVRAVVELHGERRRVGRSRSDADQLAQLTGVPAGLWVLVFAAVAVAGVAVGGYWLVPALPRLTG